MRRLGLLLVLLPSLAMGGWTTLPGVPGTTQDVVVHDGGWVVATSLSEVRAWSVAVDGGVGGSSQLTGSFVGGGMLNGCLFGLDTLRVVQAVSGCGNNSSVMGTARRFRVSPSGQSIARTTVVSTDTIEVAPDPGSVYVPAGVAWSSAALRSLQSAVVNGFEVSVMNTSQNVVRVSMDGGPPFAVSVTASALDAVPFDRFGQVALLLVSGTGATLLPQIGVPGEVPIDDATGSFPAKFVGLSTAGGSDAGAGYGVMTGATGAVLSPVPDPSQPGLTWILRQNAPLMWDRVHCLDAYRCAGFGDGGVVHVLTNAAPPVVNPDAGALFSGVSTPVTIGAVDPDGDPIFITWASQLATISGGADPERRTRDVLVSLGTECTTGSVPLDLIVSDGLGIHDQMTTALLRLDSHAGAFVQPSSQVVTAGDPPFVFTAGTDAGCSNSAFGWQGSDGQSAAGATFAWVVPQTECRADGGTYAVNLTWSDQGGHTATASSQITVRPWGRPTPPKFPVGAMQSGGTTKVWAPDPDGHTCSQSQGFPGLDLEWTLSNPPAGVMLTVVDGGLQVSAPDECAMGTVTATATALVIGEDPTHRSDAGTLTVDLVPFTPALGPWTSFDIGLVVDSSGASGVFSVADAGCVAARALSAEVSLSGPDASVVASQVYATVPGPWGPMPIPRSCGGGQFDLVAKLLENGQPTGAEVRATVDAGSGELLPGVVSPGSLPVACGVGARGILTVAPPPQGCATPVATWSQVGGPALTQPSLSGAMVEVQTVSTGLELIGDTLSLEVAVGDGSGRTATGTYPVLLTAEPFVRIKESLAPFPPREEEAQVVTVTLENTTSCAVTGLEVREALGGLVPVLSTVKGAESAEWADGVLVLRGVSLPAEGSATVTFKAQRRLVATVTFEGTAHLRDQLVSLPPPVPVAASGCGCGATGEPAAAFLGLALWALRRRKSLRRPARLG